jgi:hypothetical protein
MTNSPQPDEGSNNFEEIKKWEKRLEEWEAKSGKIYEGYVFKDSENVQKQKDIIFREYMNEYALIKEHLDKLKPQLPKKKSFDESHPILYSLGALTLVIAFFILLNLIVKDPPSTPKISDSELQRRCLESIPMDYPDTMRDNAIENCLLIGSND